jgi:hypothetical protein
MHFLSVSRLLHAQPIYITLARLYWKSTNYEVSHRVIFLPLPVISFVLGPNVLYVTLLANDLNQSLFFP